MAVIDVLTYNGEMQILRLHLSILSPYVDKFIIVEANKTFTGNEKPLYFFRDQRFFKEWWKKIEYYAVDDWDDVDLWEQALNSPNTKGAIHWKREFYIKEHIQKALIKNNVQDDDIVFVGDVDEIVDPNAHFESETPFKAKLRVYSYWLNNRSDEQFWGTLVGQYKDIKGQCLNHMRSDKSLYSQGDYLGWHFTSMGGLDEIRRKLNDSYTPESYNTFHTQQMLPERYRNGEDYLGRPFQFTLDESDWPEYLKDNKLRYKTFCK
jgi:beta-1,4-mannosyl-glycoprotein beta-1,4-N-acetylglucosaminyltransferase